MKIISLIVLTLLVIEGKSQDIFPNKDINDLRNINDKSLYKGYIIRVDNHSLIRTKLYSRKYLQTTYICRVTDRVESRFYTYFNLIKPKLTIAISIRYNII